MDIDFDEIERRLAALERRRIDDPSLVNAAVLVPMFRWEGKVHLLMVKRTESVEHHKGQVAFPGGICEPDDDGPVATALREAEEEIGIEPGRVKVLGIFHDTATITGFRITPVVGVVPYPYPFEPNPAEVAKLLRVPFDLFGNDELRKTNMVDIGGDRLQVDFYPFEDDTIWGASARIAGELYGFCKQEGGRR
ncbi:MAG: CoA pyrophosphatase [Deltaproteobacteria bacterium]|nr:MAG: CoA pyrophosphatase [Deltaproteobacteria bacterium]